MAELKQEPEQEQLIREEEIKQYLRNLLATYTVAELQTALTELSEEGYE